MNKQYPFMPIYIGLFILTLFVFLPSAQAQEGDENYCLLCHDTTKEHLQNSVHGQMDDPLSCNDCHQDYAYPHNPVLDSRAYTVQQSLTCTTCHQDQTENLADSVHYTALASGNPRAATCVDCHGSHEVQAPNDSLESSSLTCGTCHTITFDQYAQSVHGEALFNGDENVPTCTACHGVHGIQHPTTALFRNRSPQLCADCHADAELMKQYDISTNVFQTYLSDFHGTTVSLFEQQDPTVASNKAVCIDCHGVHNITSADNEKSQVAKANLLLTCQQCHPGATTDFPDSWVGHFEPTSENYPLLLLVDIFYRILIPSVLMGFGILVSTDIFRRLRRQKIVIKSHHEEHPAKKEAYSRFSPSQRFEHMALLLTFTLLGLTGLVQRYADTSLAQSLISAIGGIESVRILHRIMAVILMLEVIFHGGIVSYKILVLGRQASMMPGWRDARDAIHWVGFNLGLRSEHPRMPRYNFGEKAEYLALVWGTIIMVITGFMLWNPVTTASFLPGQVIPAARLAHSAEALLAVLSILIWHIYNVVLKRFNESIFTGKLDHESMLEEHAEELEHLHEGKRPLRQFPPEVVAQRRRWFIPYAVFMTLVLVSGLIWFVTYEDTAIETVPRQVVSSTDPLDVEALSAAADSDLGQERWLSAGCVACHGESAEGGTGLLGIKLAGTPRDLQTFNHLVRRGPADMPAIAPYQLSDVDIAHIWQWLRSLDNS